jgi:hypothetical protein
MLIGVLTLEFRLHGLRSVKEKRNIANSLKKKLRNTFNVSVADIDPSGNKNSLKIAVVHVSNSTRRVESRMNKILAMIEAVSSEELADVSMEIFGG